MTVINNWKYIRLTIIKLDDHMCRMCFAGATDIDFHVHHIDWRRSNNQCSNLVTLCRSCHMSIHAHGYKPEFNEDWPTPWKIERPSEDEFEVMINHREPRKVTPRKPWKYNESYPANLATHKKKQQK